MVAADQVELVIAAVGQPARHHGIGQPGAPTALHTHARDDLGHAERNAAERQREKHRAQVIYGCRIAPLEGVEDRPIPDVDTVLQADIGNDQDQKADR